MDAAGCGPLPALGVDELRLRRFTLGGFTEEARLDRRLFDRRVLEVAGELCVPAGGEDKLRLLVGREGRSRRQVGAAVEVLNDDRSFFLRFGWERAEAHRHEHERHRCEHGDRDRPHERSEGCSVHHFLSVVVVGQEFRYVRTTPSLEGAFSTWWQVESKFGWLAPVLKEGR
jgi:hypothetical protein